MTGNENDPSLNCHRQDSIEEEEVSSGYSSAVLKLPGLSLHNNTEFVSVPAVLFDKSPPSRRREVLSSPLVSSPPRNEITSKMRSNSSIIPNDNKQQQHHQQQQQQRRRRRRHRVHWNDELLYHDSSKAKGILDTEEEQPLPFLLYYEDVSQGTHDGDENDQDRIKHYDEDDTFPFFLFCASIRKRNTSWSKMRHASFRQLIIYASLIFLVLLALPDEKTKFGIVPTEWISLVLSWVPSPSRLLHGNYWKALQHIEYKGDQINLNDNNQAKSSTLELSQTSNSSVMSWNDYSSNETMQVVSIQI
jgi:hypothetical protein